MPAVGDGLRESDLSQLTGEGMKARINAYFAHAKHGFFDSRLLPAEPREQQGFGREEAILPRYWLGYLTPGFGGPHKRRLRSGATVMRRTRNAQRRSDRTTGFRV